MEDVLQVMAVRLMKAFNDSVVCAPEDHAREEDIRHWIFQMPHICANRFEPTGRVLQCRTLSTVAIGQGQMRNGLQSEGICLQNWKCQ